MEFSLRPFRADDADWLVAEHARSYAEAEGFDDSFGPLVAGILDDFLQSADPATEAGWVAESQTKDDFKERLGSIFCVRAEADLAKLRLFYVVKPARGSGVAQALLTTCLEFARVAGYRGMTLWTHESHKAAGAIYRRNGFRLTGARPAHSFGVDLVEETWQIAF